MLSAPHRPDHEPTVPQDSQNTKDDDLPFSRLKTTPSERSSDGPKTNPLTSRPRDQISKRIDMLSLHGDPPGSLADISDLLRSFASKLDRLNDLTLTLTQENSYLKRHIEHLQSDNTSLNQRVSGLEQVLGAFNRAAHELFEVESLEQLPNTLNNRLFFLKDMMEAKSSGPASIQNEQVQRESYLPPINDAFTKAVLTRWTSCDSPASAGNYLADWIEWLEQTSLSALETATKCHDSIFFSNGTKETNLIRESRELIEELYFKLSLDTGNPEDGMPTITADHIIPGFPTSSTLRPIYVENLATTNIPKAHAQTRLLLKQLKFQVKHIHNIDFLPGKRTEFLVESTYCDAMVARLRSLKFKVLDGFNPLVIRQHSLSDASIEKIYEDEARRVAKGLSCSKNELVQDYFQELSDRVSIPSFDLHLQKHLKILKKTSSLETSDVSSTMSE